VRKVNGVANGVTFRRINPDKFVTFAQFQFAKNSEISARAALGADPNPADEFHKWLGAAVQNRKLKIVELDNGIIDSSTDERGENVLGSGDEHSLFHQAGRITDACHIAASGFNLEVVQIRTTENNAGSRGCGKYAKGDRGSAM
jgi:hypothetical protein